MAFPVTEAMYVHLTKTLEFENLSPGARIKALLTLPTAELVDRAPPGAVPAIDGNIIPTMVTFKDLVDKSTDLKSYLPGLHWCESFFFGDCGFDVSITSPVAIENTSLNLH
jgi:hypothetical protein